MLVSFLYPASWRPLQLNAAKERNRLDRISTVTVSSSIVPSRQSPLGCNKTNKCFNQSSIKETRERKMFENKGNVILSTPENDLNSVLGIRE
jgi:hypothetical protein